MRVKTAHQLFLGSYEGLEPTQTFAWSVRRFSVEHVGIRGETSDWVALDYVTVMIPS